MIGKQVVTGAPGHADRDARSAEPRRRVRLVGALAAGSHAEIGAQHRLARGRQALHPHHEVHVQTAGDDDGGLIDAGTHSDTHVTDTPLRRQSREMFAHFVPVRRFDGGNPLCGAGRTCSLSPDGSGAGIAG